MYKNELDIPYAFRDQRGLNHYEQFGTVSLFIHKEKKMSNFSGLEINVLLNELMKNQPRHNFL